jgi:cysteine-rich repeat protein
MVGYSLDSLNICQPCNSLIANCQECSDQYTCTSCQAGYFLDGNGCVSCDGEMEYCKSCVARDKCTACRYPFVLNADKTGCTCEKGRVLTGTCSKEAGCVSSYEVGAVTLCYSCNTQNNWKYLYPFSCTCQKGYTKLNDTYCQVSCGDGLWTEEECDDGNTYDGDGCSSICVREDQFECSNVYLEKSVCRYVPRIGMEVYSLARRFGRSQVTLKISF